MPDRLASLLSHFAVRAETFQTEPLCGITEIPTLVSRGQIHLIRCGQVEVHHEGLEPLRISEPSLLMYPRPLAHRFIVAPGQSVDVVCANVAFEGGASHPIAAALPPNVCIPLTAVSHCESILAMLFSEASHDYCGRQALLDRLFEVLLIWLLRSLMDQGQVRSGMLAGLGHPKLKLALVAMHDSPQRDWSLQSLASEAGMSRTVFANGFRDVVGCTPGIYLQRWRIGLAQKALLTGRALKHIASDVGYSGEASLSRAFRDHIGVSPREWLKQSAPSA
jgi:AraC-like DNA-binding protein